MFFNKSKKHEGSLESGNQRPSCSFIEVDRRAESTLPYQKENIDFEVTTNDPESDGKTENNNSNFIKSVVSYKPNEYKPLQVTTMPSEVTKVGLTTEWRVVNKKSVTTREKKFEESLGKKIQEVVISSEVIDTKEGKKLKYVFYEKKKKKVKYYSCSEITRKISCYRDKIKKAVAKGSKKEVIENRKSWMDFWIHKRKLLK